MTLPDPEDMIAKLRAAGFDAEGARVERRDGRTAVYLGDNRHLAWFPHGEERRAEIERERRVLRLLERYCSFPAPRIVHQDDDGWQVRAMTPGVAMAQEVHDRMAASADYARRTGAALGRMLAEQHAIPAAELQGWLPDTPNWPIAENLAHLPDVVDDVSLLRRIDRALEAHACIRRGLPDPVLVHADLGPHNFAFDPASGEVTGIFDYDGAAFADRCQDFKYMLLHGSDAVHPAAMLEGAIAAYEPLAGHAVNLERVRLLNAVDAAGFLGFRFGHAPEDDWCGRTLAQDLGWTRTALEAAGF